MPRSTRHRSRKHAMDERDRSNSDKGPWSRDRKDKKRLVGDSKCSGQHEKRLSSALAKLPSAGEASGSSAEGQKMRKGRGEQEVVTGDDRWSGGGEDDRLSYHDSKKSRNSGGDVKGKSTRKMEESNRPNEFGRRKLGKGTLSEEYSANEHHWVKERVKECDAEKLKESKQVLILKEDCIDHRYKVVNDMSRDHGLEKGIEGTPDASSKVMTRSKDVKIRDLEGDKARNKSNGTDKSKQVLILKEDGIDH